MSVKLHTKLIYIKISYSSICLNSEIIIINVYNANILKGIMLLIELSYSIKNLKFLIPNMG